MNLNSPLSTIAAACAAISAAVVISFGLTVALVFVAALPARWCWNASLPALFGLRPMNYEEAVSLLCLVVIVRAVAAGIHLSGKSDA
jgi:hypothetical protein